MIRLVVLAAGKGSRLGPRGVQTPKWLLDVGGVTLAERQLEAAARAEEHSRGSIEAVHVVSGHAREAIERLLADHRASFALEAVANDAYDSLNNWYSLLLALRALPPPTSDQRVVVFNADLFADAEWLARFLLDGADAAVESLIAVDTRRPLTDESMKVSVRDEAQEPFPLLERIGKVGIGDPIGEYVGMFMARGTALADLRTALEAFVGDPAAAGRWYEDAIGRSAAAGTPWNVWSTPNSAWVEIDDEADYASALELPKRL